MDGNGNISINELLDMMAFFIEIGMDTGAVDMAKTMAEVFQRGDTNKDEKLSKTEFILVNVLSHLIEYNPSLIAGHERTSSDSKDSPSEDY
jgi:Ca2+-binding EF-hand superfamily protein